MAAVLKLLAAGLLGVSAGAMLTGGMILVPYWRSLPPTEFLSFFGQHSGRMLSFYGPLQIGSMVLAVVAALIALRMRSSDRLFLSVSAVFAIAVFVPYPIYFQHANASFVAATISTDDVAGELARWATWQWWRIGLGLAAFGASLLALRQVG